MKVLRWFLLTTLLGISGLNLGCSSPPIKEGSQSESSSIQADVSADPIPGRVEVAPELTHQADESDNKVADRQPSSEEKPNLEEKSGTEENPPAKNVLKSKIKNGSKKWVKVKKPNSKTGETTETEEARDASLGGNEMISYVVKENDTLMKISFEVFGNPFRWREILSQNQKKIGSSNAVAKGTVLKILRTKYVTVMKNGIVYLIRRKDTLWGISAKVYGSPWKWQKIWKNNEELIHDPNKIYAGFNLYYAPDQELKNTREPASSAPTSGSTPVSPQAQPTERAEP